MPFRQGHRQTESKKLIRKTRPEDFPALAEVERSAGELFRGTHIEFAADHPPLILEKHAQAVAEGTHWLAEQDGRVSGFCCSHAIDDMLYIDELAVAQPYQRRGIGRMLMDETIRHASGHFTAVSLITDRELPWNHGFYLTFGFEDWAEPHPALRAARDDEIEDGFDPATRVAMILRFG